MRITRKVFSIYSEDKLISAIEEKAFNEGYQAAKEDEGGSSTRSKALGYGALGAGAVGLGATGYGAHQYVQMNKNLQEGVDANIDKISEGIKNKLHKRGITPSGEAAEKLATRNMNNLRNYYAKALGRGDKKAQEKAEKMIKSQLGEHGDKLINNAKNFKRAALGSGAGIVGAGVLGVGYGVSRYFDKKKNKE